MRTLLRLQIILLFLCLNIMTFGQTKNNVGLDITSELDKYNNIRFGIGLTYEKKLSTQSGLETGLFYRTTKHDFQTTIETNTSFASYTYQVIEEYISIPILYRHYSKIVNISLGPNFDYFINWQAVNTNSELEITHYDISPKFNYGFQVKFGKQINMTGKLAIEPELRYSQLLNIKNHYLGLGVAVKYLF